MSSYILLFIFLIVWITIAIYLVVLDKKVKDLKKNLDFRENLKE